MKARDIIRQLPVAVPWGVGLALAGLGAFYGLSQIFSQSVAGQILFTFGWSILFLLGLFFVLFIPRILRRHGRERETKWWILFGAFFILSSVAVLCWLYFPRSL